MKKVNCTYSEKIVTYVARTLRKLQKSFSSEIIYKNKEWKLYIFHVFSCLSTDENSRNRQNKATLSLLSDLQQPTLKDMCRSGQ